VLDAAFFQGCYQLLVFLEKEVVFSTGNPEEVQFFVGVFGICQGWFGDGWIRDRSAERGDGGEGVQLVKSNGEGMEATHGKAGDSAVFPATLDPVF